MRKLRLMRKFAAPVLLASALAFAGTAVPAHAQTVNHFRFSEPVVDTITDLCAFPVQLNGVSSVHIEEFLNNDGVRVKVFFHFNNEFTLSANGKSLTERDRYNQFDVNFFEGGGFPQQVVAAGLFLHIKVPGGRAVIAAGRVIDDIVTGEVVFEKGNPVTSGDVEALCAALS